MNLYSLVCFVAAFFCGALGIFVLIRDRRSFVHWTFAAGMAALALEALLNGLSVEPNLIGGADRVIRWQRLKFIVTALIPGIWVLFSLSFARRNYREFLTRIYGLILLSFALPLILATFFNGAMFKGGPVLDESSRWLIPLGWSGYVFHLLFLLGVVVILMNLERTLRASTGHMRWQIKFMILGVGSLFVLRVYTTSQVILFRLVNMELEIVNSGVLIIACGLMIRSLARLRIFDVEFYLSQSLVYNSFTVLAVGIYFIVVGLLAQLVRSLNLTQYFPTHVFIIFIAFVGLTVLLLSDRIRQRTKRFISLNLKKPLYDYRKEWSNFAQKTTRLTETGGLCDAVTKMVSETFEALSVTLWLLDEPGGRLRLGGSTVFTGGLTKDFILGEKRGADLMRAMEGLEMPVDLMDPKVLWASEFRQMDPDLFKSYKIRYCAPLIAAGELQGILTIDDRVRKEPFLMEEFDLLKTISDQTAASLLNNRLSERLRQAKEMEAFQTISSFVVHDLKNLASTLSLTMQNLPIHFNNPDFREDALGVISQSVSKIKGMCGQLSNLSQRIELKKVETDLNKLIVSSLACLNGNSKSTVIHELQAVPRVSIDPEQIQKVLTNLLLNANEAVGNGGEIRVATEPRDGWVVISISDNGCGMSREFIENSLFRPFKTTKRQGMGIGLFQSKMIVEAHQGRIEVQSEPNKGTTFKVMIPIK